MKTKMSHEIEAKIKVTALEPIVETLTILGAHFVQSAEQIDTYFMDTHKLLHKNDCGLRIRQQIADGLTSAEVTFKGPRTDSRFKSRPEYETGIDNVAMMEKIFDALGYHKRLTFKKKRDLWRLDHCDVCLDELTELGCFVEVEGPGEAAITGVLEKLNLHNEPHITDSYALMIARKQKQE